MVIISEITENTSTMEETPSPSIKNRPENCSFVVEKGLPVVLARNFSGTTHKLFQAPVMVRHLNFSASPSGSLMKHLARTQGEDHGITSEMGAIQPYVPNISEGDHLKERLHAYLSNALRTEMKRYVSELKYSTAMEASANIPKDVINVAPLSSFKIPDGSQNDEQMYSQLSVQKRRVPTTSLGERVFSFTFPRQFVSDDKQVDDLIVNELGRQYTFSERLEGWKIERRKRINGRFDLYYYHLKSQTNYRSTIEVLNFVLHESRRDRRKSAGKEKADETDADSAQKSEVGVKRKRCSSSDADSSRKMKQKVEDSRVESEVEKFCRESRETLSSMANPSRVFESKSEYYKLLAEERREEVEKFLRDSHNNMGKSKYLSNREEELMSEEEDEDETHDFHISPRQEEKEEQPKNENASSVEEVTESDDETVSEIIVEEEWGKQEDPVPEEKETAKVGEENSRAADADAEDPVPEEKEKAKVGEKNSQAADADAVAVSEIDEAFVDIEKTPIKDTFMMGGSSSYFPPYSFDDYDLIYTPAHHHDLMDAHSFLASYPRNDGGL